MEIAYHVKEGNLLSVEEGIICHQVNCLGIMGAGIALQIRNKYPNVFDEYYKLVKLNHYDLLGEVQLIKINDQLSVANIFGQKNIGTDSRKTNYEAVDEAFKWLKNYIESNRLDSDKVYIPEKMGCMLGGGNWNVYLSIVGQYFPNINIVRYK